MSHVSLCEYLGWGDQPMTVDPHTGIIYGVKVLGLISRNGRRYDETALRQAVPLYEGARVNINHPAGDARAPRDYRDRLGFLRSVRYRDGEGLFADLHFNPKHDLAERLIWDAEHAPQNVGLSHNVLARVEHQGQTQVVTEIHRVLSVDVVADPATTSGLFEAVTPGETAQTTAAAENHEEQELTEVTRLRRELALRRHLRQWHLAPPEEANLEGETIIGPTLWELLLSEADDHRRQRLLSELANLIRTAHAGGQQVHRPTSRDPLSGDGCSGTAAFLAAITRRHAW